MIKLAKYVKVQIEKRLQSEEKIIKERKKRWIEITIFIYNSKVGNGNDILNTYFVIDGSNIAYEERSSDNKPKLSNILILKKKLERAGIDNYKIICDFSIYHCIDEQEQYSQLIKNKEIIEVPSGAKADIFILQYSHNKNAYIISNDRFKEHFDLFDKDWLEERQISFMITDNEIYFDKLIIK